MAENQQKLIHTFGALAELGNEVSQKNNFQEMMLDVKEFPIPYSLYYLVARQLVCHRLDCETLTWPVMNQNLVI